MEKEKQKQKEKVEQNNKFFNVNFKDEKFFQDMEGSDDKSNKIK